jgi:hypothetical protein
VEAGLRSVLGDLGSNRWVLVEPSNGRDVRRNPDANERQKENRHLHAEMQVIAYAKSKGLIIESVGISKNPCQDCRRKLVEKNIASRPDQGSILENFISAENFFALNFHPRIST